VSQPAATTIHCEEPVVSRVAKARSYADADLEHDGRADDRRARRRSDERQYPRFADRRNWNTDPHPPRPPCRLPPAPRARILRSPKLQGKSGRPGLGSSRLRLRTPASAGHPSQSSTGRDSSDGVVAGRRLRCLDVPCATDVAKSGPRCEGRPVSAASKARSAGIAALLSPARAPKLQP